MHHHNHVLNGYRCHMSVLNLFSKLDISNKCYIVLELVSLSKLSDTLLSDNVLRITPLPYMEVA